MIPGKKYLPEDYLKAAWRRRWFIAVPLVAVSLGTVAVAAFLPNRYKSEALLLVVPPRLSDGYVKQTTRVPIDDRIQALGQEILSRSRLETVIRDFNLYPKERSKMLMDDVIELMRTRDVAFSTPRVRRNDADSGSFTVSFEYTDPRTAMQVTEKLASLFVLENIEDRTGVVEQTDKFLQTQLDDTRRQLVDYEKRLEEFRRSRPGLMPEQMEANQQALASTQMQLQGLQESINRDRDRQLIVQRQLATLSQQPATPVAVPASDGNPSQPVTAAAQLELARTALKQMRQRLTADHPDVKKLERTIHELEQQAAVEALNQPVSATGAPADPARAAQVSDLRAEEDLIERRLTEKQANERQLVGTVEMYRKRLEAAPGVESEVTQLMRDYKTLQTVYQGLLAKLQDAKVSANVERGQIGEQFKMIDPPRVPTMPDSPNRLRLDLIGILGGLGLGVALAGFMEYRDSSLRTEADVLAALALPVVALVPTIKTAAEVQQRRKRAWVVASSGALAIVLIAAALVWKLRLLS